MTEFLSLVEIVWPRTESETHHQRADAQSISSGSTAALKLVPSEVGADRRFGRFEIPRKSVKAGWGLCSWP